ncbi:MAG TPA: hypothetical protein VGE01_04365 [Fimbriimonas sp.]
MRIETTGRATTRGLAGRDLIASLINRAQILRKDREEARQRLAAKRLGPSVQERRDDLVRFYEKYEDLVEVLCDAAQYGPTPKLERQYESLRRWMQEHYPKVRPFVLAFLREEVEPCPSNDAFAALVAKEDLDAFLREDDGRMIARITHTREALNLYGEHLRQLAAKAT